MLFKEVTEIGVRTCFIFMLLFELCHVARYESLYISFLCMEDGTRSDSFKLQQEEFRLGTKKTLLTAGYYCSGLEPSAEVLDSAA